MAGGGAGLDFAEPVVESRRSRRASMLEEVFRGLSFAWFIFGAALSGALAIFCATADVGVWGWVAGFFFFIGGMFWTLFLWAFLLLCSSIAGYLVDRTQHTRMEMVE